MDARFAAHIDALGPLFERLLAMPPVTPATLPMAMPLRGIYLLSEGSTNLYVGRSNGISGRIRLHSSPGASHRTAAFAFRLAREATGNLKPTYRKGEGSRSGLMQDPLFAMAFDAAKARIRAMDLRFVEETDPVRQALLEIYVALTLNTPYNDFDNH